jgi:hypothetical protein
VIHFRLDGLQVPGNQSFLVWETPYNTDNYVSPQTIGTTAVQVLDPPALVEERSYVRFRNLSTAGQILYFDSGATVSAAIYTEVLYPGEWSELVNVDLDLWAVASAADGVLARRVYTRL